jgi:hypothetical protein
VVGSCEQGDELLRLITGAVIVTIFAIESSTEEI